MIERKRLMKKTNEKIVESVLNYIKETQKNEGKSPSYRQICKQMGFASLRTAQHYVLLLKNRGLISQEDNGQISTPFNLSKGETIIAPLVGTVACGEPILAEENIEESFQLPTSIFGKKETMLLRAKGDSMIGVGINDGDLIVAEICNQADDGQIVVALIDDSATVKTLHFKNNRPILHPENPKYKDIITNELKIQGVVKHVIHSY